MANLKFRKVLPCRGPFEGAVGISDILFRRALRAAMKVLSVIFFLFSSELILYLLFLGVPNASAVERRVDHADPAVEAGFDFLYRQMDKINRSVAVTGESGYPSSSPNRKMGDIEFNLSSLKEPRFLQSYCPQGCNLGDPDNPKVIDAPVDICHVYDQALTLLAFLARGTAEDVLRAKLIGDALVKVQDNDRYFSDGRLRNSYVSGPLMDPVTKKARLPGQWDDQTKAFLEDEYAAGSDTGNAAWAALALVQAQSFLPPREGDIFLNAARKIGRWIVNNNRVEDAFGGFQGGFEDFEPTKDHPGGQFRCTWRSTEHNIDLVALFDHLALAVGKQSAEGRMWSEQRAHARKFVQRMWQDTPVAGHFYTGAVPDALTINRNVIALDTQTWSILGLGEPQRYGKALDWALRHCGAKDIENAFDFNCNDGDGAWWEGTAQMATALKFSGRIGEAVPIIEQLKKTQIKEGLAAGAMPAASRCGLTTGFRHFWHSAQIELPWLYPNSPHVGATAWFLFAVMGKNPYYLRH